jgi:hypothetical protein
MPRLRIDDASLGTIFCNYECERRPRDEFHDDSEFGLVHFKNVKEPHTTLGDVIKPHEIPPLGDRIREETGEELGS